MGMAFVGLSVLGELPWWVTIVVLVREVGITAMRFVVIRHGVMPAGRGGKVKTMLQAVAIGSLRAARCAGGWHVAAELVMAAAVVVTVVTGVDYVIRARTLRRTSPAGAGPPSGVPSGERERPRRAVRGRTGRAAGRHGRVPVRRAQRRSVGGPWLGTRFHSTRAPPRLHRRRGSGGARTGPRSGIDPAAPELAGVPAPSTPPYGSRPPRSSRPS